MLPIASKVAQLFNHHFKGVPSQVNPSCGHPYILRRPCPSFPHILPFYTSHSHPPTYKNPSNMVFHSNGPHWEAPKFSFSAFEQSEEWKVFYTQAIDFLEGLNINTEEEDSIKKAQNSLKLCMRIKIDRHSRP